MKRRTKETWLKALKETLKHYIIILIILLINGLIGYFSSSGLSYKDLINILIEFFLYSISYPLPILIAVFISYLIIYSNLQKSKKILFTILLYLFLGLSVPLAILIAVGIGFYTGDTEEMGIALAILFYALLIYSILIVGNYLFMYFRNKKYFNKSKNEK